MIKNNNPLNNNPNKGLNNGDAKMISDEKYKKIITKNMVDHINNNPLPPGQRKVLDLLNIPYSPVDDFLKKLRKKKKNQKLIKK
jgi:hypothetical protein